MQVNQTVNYQIAKQTRLGEGILQQQRQESNGRQNRRAASSPRSVNAAVSPATIQRFRRERLLCMSVSSQDVRRPYK